MINFTLSDKLELECSKFISQHKKCIKEKSGISSLGMQFTYLITPGVIGTSVGIRCNLCGEEKNITDTNCWK